MLMLMCKTGIEIIEIDLDVLCQLSFEPDCRVRAGGMLRLEILVLT